MANLWINNKHTKWFMAKIWHVVYNLWIMRFHRATVLFKLANQINSDNLYIYYNKYRVYIYAPNLNFINSTVFNGKFITKKSSHTLS